MAALGRAAPLRPHSLSRPGAPDAPLPRTSRGLQRSWLRTRRRCCTSSEGGWACARACDMPRSQLPAPRIRAPNPSARLPACCSWTEQGVASALATLDPGDVVIATEQMEQPLEELQLQYEAALLDSAVTRSDEHRRTVELSAMCAIPPQVPGARSSHPKLPAARWPGSSGWRGRSAGHPTATYRLT